MRGRAVLTVLVGLAALPPVARAQVDPCAGGLDPARIIECLRPGGINSTTRGIRPAAGRPQAASSTMPGQTIPAGLRTAPTAPPVSAVDLNVPFGFDSADLTSAGTAALAALSTALRDASLAAAKFRIAGHTDGQGPDDYNQTLSERRAEAALRYLVDQGGVDPARLTAIGYGRHQLYDAANPAAAVNRRVQVIRLDN